MSKNRPTPKRTPNGQHLLKEALAHDLSKQVIEDLPWDPENPLVVNSCSGHSNLHTPDCDNHCPPKEMTEWDIKIENERRAWARLGITPNADELRRESQIQTIIKLLDKHLGITEDQFNAEFKPIMFGIMNSLRTTNEQAIKSAQLRNKLHIPGQQIQ